MNRPFLARARHAFTLLEVCIVVIIIALMLAVVIPLLLGKREPEPAKPDPESMPVPEKSPVVATPVPFR